MSENPLREPTTGDDEWRQRPSPGQQAICHCSATEPASTGKYRDHHENPAAMTEYGNESHRMRRVEMRCSRCESQLGQVFPDGPAPARLRHCIKSAALKLEGEPAQ